MIMLSVVDDVISFVDDVTLLSDVLGFEVVEEILVVLSSMVLLVVVSLMIVVNSLVVDELDDSLTGVVNSNSDVDEDDVDSDDNGDDNVDEDDDEDDKDDDDDDGDVNNDEDDDDSDDVGNDADGNDDEDDEIMNGVVVSLPKSELVVVGNSAVKVAAPSRNSFCVGNIFIYTNEKKKY